MLQLFAGMGDPADGAGHREQRELAARRKTQAVRQHGQRVIDIDELAGCFRDPDGHVWEIAWNPGFTLGPDGSLVLPDFG